jgi:CheY-like chemotaxis protein/HPt (histidine-containing phosphotransfer) domain-containing protein
MGGRIWIESEVGRGSRFHFAACFTLPPGSSDSPRAAGSLSLEGLRVLVVDDNATNRRILEEMLRDWRMDPAIAEAAAPALALLQSAGDAGDPFRLVLIDALMPDVDGLMLAREIRRDARFADAILIMLTSAPLPEVRLRARQAGFAACLSKPIKQSDLFDLILATLGPPAQANREPAGGFPRPAASRSKSLHILVAEDNPTNQKLVVALLEQQGHRVELASDGRQALAQAAEQDFDLILMDVQMPELSGLEACAAIRERESGTRTHVPIVALTAHAMTGDRERCLAAGMDGYVSKPLRPDELFAAIETVLAPPAGQEPAGREAAADRPAPPPLDAGTLLAGFGGNRKLLGEVIDLYLADTPRILDEARRALARRDAAALASSAHALKGSMGLFAQTGAYEAARRLERAARAGELAGIEATFEELDVEARQLSEDLQSVSRSLRPL